MLDSIGAIAPAPGRHIGDGGGRARSHSNRSDCKGRQHVDLDGTQKSTHEPRDYTAVVRCFNGRKPRPVPTGAIPGPHLFTLQGARSPAG